MLPKPGCFVEIPAFIPLTPACGRIIMVQMHVRQHRPEPHFPDSLFRRRNHPVLVVECRRSRPDHLQAGDFRSPVDTVFVDFPLHIPDSVYPVRKADILRHTAQQGHRSMGLRIDKPRKRDLPFTVHHLRFHVCLRSLPGRSRKLSTGSCTRRMPAIIPSLLFRGTDFFYPVAIYINITFSPVCSYIF